MSNVQYFLTILFVLQDPKMCVLCPRQYQESIVPDYKNPKLLSQFVSPHTGNVYQSHITGLCKYMQVCIIKF